ncbi:MAG: ATP-binding protein [Nitrospirota bacterium]|nr:ATP-binding protein [Nitrospirota bacterium]MDH5768679.1 ATP-binding protein [Nitrospirota bacterium]
MKDKEKSKEQLINEVAEMRKKLAGMKKREREFQKIEKKLQEQFVEYEKLSAIGRLTANVAHEIRNPITVIGGLTRRLETSVSFGTKEKEYLELISLEANRLEEVLKDVLTFSDKTIFHRDEQDIHEVIDESLSIYKDMCKNRSIGIQNFSSDVPKLYIDKRQIKEAIKNLISNAIDAMPNGGIVTITTNKELLNRKNYVTVMITDTGVGILEEEKRMIFEPFFTTKMAKKDIGLGLPITKKIIEGHGGFIKVDSTIGEGSTFTVYLPYRAAIEK